MSTWGDLRIVLLMHVPLILTEYTLYDSNFKPSIPILVNINHWESFSANHHSFFTFYLSDDTTTTMKYYWKRKRQTLMWNHPKMTKSKYLADVFPFYCTFLDYFFLLLIFSVWKCNIYFLTFLISFLSISKLSTLEPFVWTFMAFA